MRICLQQSQNTDLDRPLSEVSSMARTLLWQRVHTILSLRQVHPRPAPIAWQGLHSRPAGSLWGCNTTTDNLLGHSGQVQDLFSHKDKSHSKFPHTCTPKCPPKKCLLNNPYYQREASCPWWQFDQPTLGVQRRWQPLPFCPRHLQPRALAHY